MRYIKAFSVILITILSCGLTSCFKERDLSYQGSTLVEFKNHRSGFIATANAAINNLQNTPTSRTVRQSAGQDSIRIQLIGPQRSEPITINYEIASSSTAVENTHYRIVGQKGQVVIPANSSSANIILQPINNSIATAAENRSIVFVLRGNNEIAASVNFSNFTYNIRQ